MVHKKIENWAVRITGDEYTPPEYRYRCLTGTINGTSRQTSGIVKAEGRLVTTDSGSVYELGEVDPEYKKWVEESTGKEIDPVQPIKIIAP